MSDEYEEVEMAAEEPITRHLEPWNIIGIAATGIGGLFGVMSQAMNMVATECWIHARWVGEQRELRAMAEAEAAERELEYEARREMAESYERLIGMDTYWLGDIDASDPQP